MRVALVASDKMYGVGRLNCASKRFEEDSHGEKLQMYPVSYEAYDLGFDSMQRSRHLCL